MNSSCDDSYFDYKDTNVSSSSFVCVFLSFKMVFHCFTGFYSFTALFYGSILSLKLMIHVQIMDVKVYNSIFAYRMYATLAASLLGFTLPCNGFFLGIIVR